MKQIVYEDIVCLDARRLSEEAAVGIRAIRDVTLVLVSEASAPILARIPMADVCNVICLPEDAECLSVNGQHTLTSGGVPAKLYLIVNGQLTIDPEMTPSQIAQTVAGGIVNGQLCGTASQLQAINLTGIRLNGQAVAYPDGYRLRQGKQPLGLGECAMLAEGAKLYLTRQVLLEPGVPGVLRARDVKLDSRAQIFLYENDASAMAEIYTGDSSKCIPLPDGFTLRMDGLSVNRRNASALRGKLYVDGDLLAEPVDFVRLKALECLHVTGRAYIPLEAMDGWLSLVVGEPEWMPYEGRLLVNRAALRLSRLTEPTAILNRGVLTLDAALAPEVLREKVTLLENNGMLEGTPAQLAALCEALCGNGATRTPDSADETAPPKDPDCIYISDIVSHVI